MAKFGNSHLHLPQHRRVRNRVLVVCAALAGLLGPTTVAVAQEHPATVPLQVEHFEPLPNPTTNIWNVATSKTMGHMGWTTGVLFHYAAGLFKADVAGEEQRLIDKVLKAEVWGALGILGVAEIGIVVPVALYQTGDDLAVLGRAGQQVDGVGLGDIRVVLKSQLIDPKLTHGAGLGFVVPVSLPTGDEVSYNSESGVRMEPRLVFDFTHESGIQVAANIGYYIRDEHRLLNLGIGPEARWGFALAAPVGVDGLQAVGSIFGAIGTEDDLDPKDLTQVSKDVRNSPAEWLLGARYDGAYGAHLGLAGGMGLNGSVGAPEYRVLLSLGWGAMNFDSDGDGVADPDDACPAVKEDADGFEDADGCPENDNDGDTIEDAIDGCPNLAEDADGFEDEDGCPDDDNDGDGVSDADDGCVNEAEDLDGFEDADGCPEDNDGDGIADADDGCPDVAEDIDGFEDEDGCPDEDNDADGVADADDACRDSAEDPDGFEDEDGCPDLDNDHDGFADSEDRCPLEAEVINGFEDEDGCPDEGEVKVVVLEDKIEIREKVFFDTSKATIKERSFGLLDQVASVLRANPQIKKIRIEGHTDNTGKADKNQALSQARAESVRDYLIGKGIEPVRLEAMGYGQDKPIADNATKAGKDTNRRVEFTIVE